MNVNVSKYLRARIYIAKHFVNKQNRLGNDENSKKAFAYVNIIFHIDFACEVPKPQIKTSHSRELWHKDISKNDVCLNRLTSNLKLIVQYH